MYICSADCLHRGFGTDDKGCKLNGCLKIIAIIILQLFIYNIINYSFLLEIIGFKGQNYFVL